MEPKKIRPYNTLPQDVRDVIESSEIDEHLAEITKQFNLHIDQGGQLYSIVNSIMTGQIPPAQFIEITKTTLKLDTDQATKIAQAVNEKIFLPIRESLKRIHAVGEVSAPRENAPLEKKKDVLQAIEAPESVPMNTRVMEATPAKPEPLTIIPPEPAPVVTPAPIVPPVVVPPPTPTPVPEIKIEAPKPVITPTPVPVVAPAPISIPKAPTPVPEVKKEVAPQAPAPQKAAFDPYREAAA